VGGERTQINRLAIGLLIIGLVVGGVIGAYIAPPKVEKVADAYLSAKKPDVIKAPDLYALLDDDDPANDPFILDTRNPEHFKIGHIPGAVNIPTAEAAKPENLAKLPKDKKIVVYCYMGYRAGQITMLLNTMGYDAANLHWGIASWTTDTTVAPVRFTSADENDFPVETGL
jgi:rhodanese-related sulfurtransferase